MMCVVLGLERDLRLELGLVENKHCYHQHYHKFALPEFNDGEGSEQLKELVSVEDS